MKEKKTYNKPIIEIENIELEDAICTSGVTGKLPKIDFGDLFDTSDYEDLF